MKTPKFQHVTLTRTAAVAHYRYTHGGIQQMIQDIVDTYGVSQFELAKRAGLTPAAIYQILKKNEKQVTRPPRRSTVLGLAQAVGADVTFDSTSNMVYVKYAGMPETKNDSITQFLMQVADAVKQSGRTEIGREERDKILRVLRVLL